MNQSFSADQVIKLCKKTELIDYSITLEKLKDELNEAFEKITNGNYDFSFNKHKGFLSCNNLTDKLILRKLNDNIKKLYKDKQANRRIIIYQIKTLLEDQCPLWVYRTDISSFYASIDRSKIIEKLKGDSILTYFSIKLIDKLFEHPLVSTTSGLPLGISISATLSELYMRPFDKWVRTQPGIYYYSRFVDDIIVFAYKEEAAIVLEKNIENNLPSGLKKNELKSKHFDGKRIIKTKPLEFLGYKFYLEKETVKKTRLTVSISTDKVKKIKSRIILAFTSYLSNRNEALLINRIKFLTGNYTIKSNFDGNDLKAGIYFNYSHVNEITVFQELNLFYYKTLNSKRYSLGKRLSIILSPTLKYNLSRHSFKHGFKNKVFHKFNATTMKQISSCWR